MRHKHLPFLDFSTVEARRFNGQEEVRLNRRLAPDLYLGVVALYHRSGGLFWLGAPPPEERDLEQPVDWLVHMRRLPEAGLLDQAIARGPVSEAALAGVGRHLAAFYRTAYRPTQSGAEHVARLAADLADSFAVLRPSPWSDLAPLYARLEARLARAAATLRERAGAGWIVEGHGDLRPEHVFLGPPPAIIDCVEFDHALRSLDVAKDLALLRLECARLGARQVAQRITEACFGALGGAPPVEVLELHVALRALVRAKLALWHVADSPGAAVRWQARARQYFELAAAALSAPAA